MQDNINNNKHDAFSELIKQKLENHQLPVDSSVWGAIEKQLKPKRKIIPWWMWLPVGSAVVIALLFTVGNFDEKSQSNFTVKPKVQSENNSSTLASRSITQQKAAIHTTKVAQLTSHQVGSNVAKQNSNTVLNLELKKSDAAHTVAITSSQSNVKLIETELNKIISSETDLVAVNEIDSVATRDTKKKAVLDTNPDEYIASISNSKKKEIKSNNWMLAASYGSQSRSDINSKDELFAINTDRFAFAKAPALYARVMEPNEFITKNYHDPMSLGLSVSKGINKIMSIESGIVYTYLYSTFENKGVQRSDAKSHLHYVGIPVGLVTKIWTKKKFGVYFSVGGMAEKGLQSIYVQNVYNGNQTITTKAKTKINGVQWSVNTGLGVGYTIRNQISIYLEPKLSYYFDNDQPASARTDHPTVIGLNAGLRIGL